MKLIIAGSRHYPRLVAVQQLHEMQSWIKTATEIVSGCAAGPDTWGIEFARTHGIPQKLFPANWQAHPRAAGMLRNKEMLDYGTALLAFWDGKSKGTEHMIRIAGERGLPVFICKPYPESYHAGIGQT